MSSILIFGPGYTASRIAAALNACGWHVAMVGRSAIGDLAAVSAQIAAATHILSSVPPDADGDPVLVRHADALAASDARWIGYLSSSGVYGDTGGAWVDETAPVGGGRRSARTDADLAWQALHAQVRVFRLPGIYGPGRSPLDRVREGKAHRIDLPGQVFSRIHVDDIVGGVLASVDRGPAGVFNIADDRPVPQNKVIAYASALLGVAPPPLLTLAEAKLSPAAAAFYAENRRVSAGKARRLLGWRPLYPDYRAGLAALSAMTSPISANADPAIAGSDQR
ncbi:SDR family NAD(P)-dependent oxidoreductase [Sphingomonas montanisoli]|uniref:SDR family NAD(P)-dependent oxidoreductase n=1 Tax=Sphingomonas montanisoli TaxID=2606412 RepID=A0A5D9C8W6_9SPHN|nr:SDR family NAD(P)-dependent oxidoreductase [Sphingomonas montanisoli]TZG26425.1 SDR family NAD(P)-dependent oxidoreductase [Sphingomonas montanisoli]